MGGRRRTVVVLAAAVAVVVAAVVAFVALRGNGSTVQPGPATTASSSPPVNFSPTAATGTPTSSASAGPTPSAPKMQPTAESALAVAKYFFAAYNYGFQNLDTAPIKAVSDSKCAFCTSTVRNIDGVKSRDARATGGRIEVREAIVGPGELNGDLAVLVLIDQLPGDVRDDNGTVISTVRPSKNTRAEVALRWSNGAWRIMSVTVKVS